MMRDDALAVSDRYAGQKHSGTHDCWVTDSLFFHSQVHQRVWIFITMLSSRCSSVIWILSLCSSGIRATTASRIDPACLTRVCSSAPVPVPVISETPASSAGRCDGFQGLTCISNSGTNVGAHATNWAPVTTAAKSEELSHSTRGLCGCTFLCLAILDLCAFELAWACCLFACLCCCGPCPADPP